MDLNQLVRKLEQKKSALVAFRDSRWPKRDDCTPEEMLDYCGDLAADHVF